MPERQRGHPLGDNRRHSKRVSLFDRWEEGEIGALVDALDEDDPEIASDANLEPTRWRYRRRLKVALTSSNDVGSVYQVFGRALNADQLWFVGPALIYPGSSCDVQLLTSHNMWQDIEGVVTGCRYVGDRAYEIVVRLAKRLELLLFVPEAVRRHVLVVDDEATSRGLLRLMLERMNADVTVAEDGEGALQAIQVEAYDVIVLDIEMPPPDGFATLERLRKANFPGVVVAVTSWDTPDMERRCRAAGFDAFLGKPVRRPALERALHTQAEPLFSAHASDPGMEELVDHFARGLAALTCDMDVACQRGDYAELARHLRVLRADAGGCGFDPLSEMAEAVQEQLTETPDVDSLRISLNQLIALCKQVRTTASRE